MKTLITTFSVALAMLVTSINASECLSTTKRGYVFSESPEYVIQFMNLVAKHDMEGAMRMIKEEKVHPLKEGLDVMGIIEESQASFYSGRASPLYPGLVRFIPCRSGRLNPGFSWSQKGVWTVSAALERRRAR